MRVRLRIGIAKARYYLLNWRGFPWNYKQRP